MPVVTAENFWQNKKVRALPPKAKLILAYAITQRDDVEPIIAEDVALATGIAIDECSSWLRIFYNRQMIEGYEVAA